MPFYEANLDGTLVLGSQYLEFNPLDEVKSSLEQNNWIFTESEHSGTSFLKGSISIGEISKQLTFTIGKIQNQEEGRNSKEKRIQISPQNTTIGFNFEESENQLYTIIGVYRREIYDDVIFCAWSKEVILNPNKQISVRVKIDLIAEALTNGFARTYNDANQLVCAFRPEFIHYYLLNKNQLHDSGADKILEQLGQSDREYPLNQILYGAPGTGKTHNAINHALAIVTGKNLKELIESEKVNPNSRKEAMQEFAKYVTDGQIQFVTFHQSYSYEEFVEGIKPCVNGTNIEYSIKDGIFKNLCRTAQESLSYDFDDIYEDFYHDLIINELKLETSSQKKKFTVKVDEKRDVVYIITSRGKRINIAEKSIYDYFQTGVISSVWYDKSYVRAIGDYLKNKYSSKIQSTDNSNKNYVLIIDEINRGNISKIFGELITVIEDSKRIGEKEEIKVKLAYTGTEDAELFGVPNNLYIIGTMNSTDKSIALIDTALRRRFTFFEYKPDPSILSNVDGINLQELLRTINNRIEFFLDKDHLLGHAYFLKVKSKSDLCMVFRNKIIPLLEEYFYGDYAKISLILGDNKGWGKTEEEICIQEKKGNTPSNLFGNGVDEFDDKTIYQINPRLVEEKYDEIPVGFFTSIYTKKHL